MIRGDFEIREINLVKSIDFNYFIDIGAHIGYYSVAIGTHKKCPVLAFEPNFKNYQSLIKNLEINKIDYVAKNVGLSNESGSAILFGDDGAGSLNKATFATIPDKTSTITLKKLDEFISLIPKNAKVFIKIDVEGNEYNLLQGSIEFIKQVKPVAMLMEISPVWSNGKNPHHESTLTLLKSLNYKVNEISSGSYIFKCMGDTNSVS
jgi:FkbM family methyltransferase